MNFPIKLKIINLSTEEESKGFAVLKNSPYNPGFKDVVILSNDIILKGHTFKGEQGFKYAYDYFTCHEEVETIEDIMKSICDDALHSKNIIITIIKEKKFKEIKL